MRIGPNMFVEMILADSSYRGLGYACGLGAFQREKLFVPIEYGLNFKRIHVLDIVVVAVKGCFLHHVFQLSFFPELNSMKLMKEIV